MVNVINSIRLNKYLCLTRYLTGITKYPKGNTRADWLKIAFL